MLGFVHGFGKAWVGATVEHVSNGLRVILAQYRNDLRVECILLRSRRSSSRCYHFLASRRGNRRSRWCEATARWCIGFASSARLGVVTETGAFISASVRALLSMGLGVDLLLF